MDAEAFRDAGEVIQLQVDLIHALVSDVLQQAFLQRDALGAHDALDAFRQCALEGDRLCA